MIVWVNETIYGNLIRIDIVMKSGMLKWKQNDLIEMMDLSLWNIPMLYIKCVMEMEWMNDKVVLFEYPKGISILIESNHSIQWLRNMNEWMNEWMDGWMNEWMNEWMIQSQ